MIGEAVKDIMARLEYDIDVYVEFPPTPEETEYPFLVYTFGDDFRRGKSYGGPRSNASVSIVVIVAARSKLELDAVMTALLDLLDWFGPEEVSGRLIRRIKLTNSDDKSYLDVDTGEPSVFVRELTFLCRFEI